MLKAVVQSENEKKKPILAVFHSRDMKSIKKQLRFFWIVP